jgi:hypothetical protein
VVVGLCTGCCQHADSWKRNGTQQLTSSEEHCDREVVSGGGFVVGIVVVSGWLDGSTFFLGFGLDLALASLSLQLAIDAKS